MSACLRSRYICHDSDILWRFSIWSLFFFIISIGLFSWTLVFHNHWSVVPINPITLNENWYLITFGLSGLLAYRCLIYHDDWSVTICGLWSSVVCHDDLRRYAVTTGLSWCFSATTAALVTCQSSWLIDHGNWSAGVIQPCFVLCNAIVLGLFCGVIQGISEVIVSLLSAVIVYLIMIFRRVAVYICHNISHFP